MKRIIRLTESDLTRIVRRVINERQYLMEEGMEHVKLQVYVPQKTDATTKKTFYDYTAGLIFEVVPAENQKKTFSQLMSITINGVSIPLTQKQGLVSTYYTSGDPKKIQVANSTFKSNFVPGTPITSSGLDGIKVNIQRTDNTIVSYLATPISVVANPQQY